MGKYKDQESKQSSTTLDQDTVWVSDKSTRKHHKQNSQEVSPFLRRDYTSAQNRDHRR